MWPWANSIPSWALHCFSACLKNRPLGRRVHGLFSFATVQFSPSCSPQFLSPWFLEASLIKLIGPPFGKFSPHFSAALMGPALSLSGNPFFFWHCSLGSPVSLGCSSSLPEAGVSWPGCPVSLGVLLVPVAFLWLTWSFWMKGWSLGATGWGWVWCHW